MAFSIPVCSSALLNSIPTPRGLDAASLSMHLNAITMSGLEVELVVRAWGVGNAEGLGSKPMILCLPIESMFLKQQMLSVYQHANNKGTGLALPKSGRRSRAIGSLEKYYERLTSVLSYCRIQMIVEERSWGSKYELFAYPAKTT